MKKILPIVIIMLILILGVFGFKYFEEQKELELKERLEQEQYEQKMIGLLEENIVIQVYIKNEVNEERIIEIGKEIEQIEHIINIEFISKEKALETMREALSDNAELLDGFEGENNVLPASYKIYCKIDNIDNLYYEDVIEELAKIDGVDEVKSNHKSMIKYYETDMLEEFLEKVEEANSK